MTTTERFDLVGAIIEFEEGVLSQHDTFALFGHLIKTGQAWVLQGSYGRAAAALIDDGFIDPDGTVNWDRIEEVLDR